MEVVTISSKFQVVIPRSVRKILAIEPGEKMQVISYKNRIELIPQRSAKTLRGSLRGINTDVLRDEDRV